MIPSVFRMTAAVVLSLSVAACGGNDAPVAPPPTPTASLAISPSTITVVAGTSIPVTVTVTRGGGFAGEVTVTATSLPTGVTATPITIASGVTSGILTLVAAASAPAATAGAVAVAGSGTGVTIGSQSLTVNVTGAPGNGATLALAAASGSVEGGRTGTIAVTVTRTGTFTGEVTVSAVTLPTGVTIASQTIAAGTTAATLTITTNLGAAAGTTSLSIAATGTGITIPSQAFALTITQGPIAQLGGDIANTDLFFGHAIALNADGTRMVVGAYGSANGTTRVYERSGASWTQLGANILGEGTDDGAGTSVAINAAGTRIAIGAPRNDGTGANSGQVRVFDLVAGSWTQVGTDIDGDAAGWTFGWRLALSASGSRLIVSGIIDATLTGNIKVYDLVGSVWTQVGNVLTQRNRFGDGVDISSDGTTIAIGSPQIAGSSIRGVAQVFRLVGSTWTRLANELQGEGPGDGFGTAVSLSATGNRLAVSAPKDGEGGNFAGKVRVFELVGSTWTQVGGDVIGEPQDFRNAYEFLGGGLVLSDDGSRFAVNSVGRDNEAGKDLVKVYTLTGGAWTQTGPTIFSYGAGAAVRPEGVALSADGRTVATGYVSGSPRVTRAFRITP